MIPDASAPHEGARGRTEGSATHVERDALRRTAFRLEYATIAWNVLEGVVAIVAGLAAGSVSLVAFGLDSTVEVFASAAVVWELRGVDRGRERRALRVIGLGYLVVAAYVGWDASTALAERHRPGESVPGMTFLVATVAAMAIVGIGKLRVGARLGSPTVRADGRFSLIDGALAAAVLAGLALAVVAGWWWADEVLALGIALLALREGIEAWRGDEVAEDTAGPPTPPPRRS